MSIKQFLKPDWKNILIFVIILLIGFLIPILPAYCNFCPNCGACAPGTTCNLSSFGNAKTSDLFNYEGKGDRCGIIYNTNAFYFSALIIVIDMIFYYLLSCLIVWIYDNSRKEKDQSKPVWRKIVLFIIISILGYSIFNFPFLFIELSSVLFYILFIIFDPFIFIFVMMLNSFGYSTIVGVVLNIIYWYLLSYLVIWVYDKLRKNKVKKK